MLAPFNHITAPLQQVLFPALSRMQDDPKRLADVWIRVTRLVAAVAMPALVGLVVVAPDFVSTVLGQEWSAATPVIRILAVVGLIQALQHLNGEILYALDRAGTFFRFTIFWAIASVVAFGIGVQWGIVGVAACYAISSVIVEPVSAYLTARALDLPLRRLRCRLERGRAGCGPDGTVGFRVADAHDRGWRARAGEAGSRHDRGCRALHPGMLRTCARGRGGGDRCRAQARSARTADVVAGGETRSSASA